MISYSNMAWRSKHKKSWGRKKKSYGTRRMFGGKRRSMKKKLKRANKVVIKRFPSRNIFGDKALSKLRACINGVITLAAGATSMVNFENATWNSLSSVPFGANLQGEISMAQFFQKYRVLGIKFCVTFYNNGLAATAVNDFNATVANPAILCSISAESLNAQTTAPITTAAYWQPQSILTQRWAKSKVIGGAGSGRAQCTVKAYYSLKKLHPDYVTSMEDTNGNISHSGTAGTQPGTYTAPTDQLTCGFGISSLSSNGATGTQQLNVPFIMRYTLYVEYWNKQPNFNIS